MALRWDRKSNINNTPERHFMEASELQNLTSLIEQIGEDSKGRTDALQSLVEGVARDVTSLAKILTVGNGQPPITVRMALVEKLSSDAMIQITRLREEIETKRETVIGRRWQLYLVFGTCVVSLLTAILPHLLKH